MEKLLFYASQLIFKTWFFINDYVPIGHYVKYVTDPCIKKLTGESNQHGTPHDTEITISQVYYRPVSSHQLTDKKHLVYGVVNLDNIKDVWTMIEHQVKHKPNIGDIIEVHYTVPIKLSSPVEHFTHVPYNLAYVYPCNIHFPPYTLDEIKKYQTDGKYKKGVLFAECGDEDVTTECVKYAGPMGNFYSDLPPRFGIRVIRDLIGDVNKKFVLTTNDGDEIEFKRGEVLKL